VPSASMPAAAVAGQKTKASVRVEVGNTTGVAFSGPVTIRLVASTDGTIDAGDAEVLSVVKTLKIKPSTTKAVKLKVKSFPATLADGNYQLIAEVTPPTGSASAAATGSATAVAAPFVNLVGVTAAGPSALTAGKKGKLGVTVQNTGNVTLAGTASVQIEAALGGNLAAKTPVATVPVKLKLKPGQVKRLSLKFLVPAELVAGPYNLVATLDSANVIAESLETDNVVNSATATDVV
ncbi:MAG TPA: CARDB domain-containing protein, partial [Humisphaera sp.]